MKQLIIVLILLTLNTIAFAQETLFIKEGDQLQYSVTVNGQIFPMYIQVSTFKANNFSITWRLENGHSGKFIMQRSSLDSGGLGYWSQPIDGNELELPPTQNVLLLSRLVYSKLQKNKTVMFDEYNLKLNPGGSENIFKLNNKTIDALYLVSDGKCHPVLLYKALY